MKKNLYLIHIIAFFFVLPLVAAVVQHLTQKPATADYAVDPYPYPFPFLLLMWLVFFGIGCRLTISGLSQIIKPSFTANNIFGLKGSENFSLIRELGFTNLALGILGLLVLPFFPIDSFMGYVGFIFTIPTALAGILFYGMAGIQHAVRPGKTRDEWVTTISDCFVALALLGCGIMSLVAYGV